MYRRIAAITVTSLLLVAATASSAFAWANGGDNGNGYGTHDWLLEHAITLAGGNGDWVDVKTALLASDDPDSQGTSTYLHTYMEYGRAQGGPQQVADVYYKLVQAYQAGNYTEASRQLGVMSHYYSDITQPYHTDTRGTSSVNSRHYNYEVDVSAITRRYSDSTGWLTNRSRKTVTDVRRNAVSAALYARTKYVNLDASYKYHGAVKGYAYTATGYVLNRAVNDLADIIATVPSGQGLAEAPATMSQKMMKMTYYYPRRGSNFNADKICSQVYCYDAEGKPMRAVAVTFTWPFADGEKSYVAYTDANGYAYNWQAPGTGISLMQRRTLSARTVASGETATSTTWYMPTPVLATGTSGVKTTVSNSRPKRGTNVKAWTRFRDTNGNPVSGLPVTFKWYFKTKTITVKAVTNANGYAYTTRNIGQASKGYRVYVKGLAYSGRYERYSRASFIPQ